MTQKEFRRALARTRLKARAADVARLVFIDGVAIADAGRRMNITRQAAAAAVARVRRAARPSDWKTVTVIVPPSVVDEVRNIERREIKRAGIPDD